MDIKNTIHRVKECSFQLASLPEQVRNDALAAVCEGLEKHADEIFAANSLDLQRAEAEHLPGPIVSRLKFDRKKMDSCIAGARDLIDMEDPLFRVLLKRRLDDGLVLTKQTCPIGVIGVIFESRPDALVQIACLCIKSGNGIILKGGSEAKATNRALFDAIEEAALDAGLPSGFAALLEDRQQIDQLLTCDEDVDLLIPRGSNAFVQYIMDHSNIPVMGHADGICHVYVDRDADIEKSIPVIIDSKTQYPAACNAAETLLVHRDIAEKLLPALAGAAGGDIRFLGDPDAVRIIGCDPATPEDDRKEYLDYILSVRIVDSADEAIAHINRFGSHHTDCILTENDETADRFMALVDSAGVYRNCSTRFADGFRYGFGAEVGISTGKLHARGPVGLDGLVTYKYRLTGDGHVVADYASGKSRFHFRDL